MKILEVIKMSALFVGTVLIFTLILIHATNKVKASNEVVPCRPIPELRELLEK